ncbi:hypothetical protein TRSC58_07281 [Trypanosoma rangeli SC58]|uniref:Transmembrane protein n=1 Tax=Trypanosoma rangeli SC58 TaxID=429131 RepID=A0A061ITL6_TRYRA|nr:hypothetical protein TRSC58_07281 [Trypanosoma rangeli SC58]
MVFSPTSFFFVSHEELHVFFFSFDNQHRFFFLLSACFLFHFLLFVVVVFRVCVLIYPHWCVHFYGFFQSDDGSQ